MKKIYKILIADDEAEIRNSMIKNIPWEELGYEVVGDAENGRDALEKISILDPDVLLTDIKMPFMNGMSLIEEIRKEREDMEIVIFSGFDEFEYAKQAIKHHVTDYILKPVNATEMKEILIKIHKRMDEESAKKKNENQLKERENKRISEEGMKHVHNVVEEAKEYTKKHFQEPELSLESICKYFHIKPAYFSSIFKKETGESYSSWVDELRLNKAKELLMTTDEKAYLVALKVGYKEPNYFSYLFKKKFGVNPVKFRSSLKEH